MPRTARAKSESGIYHVMLRGTNRQQIFYDEEDCENFRNLLSHYKKECGFELYAYCLMGNHVHLLLKEGTEPLEVIFKSFGASFVYHYNEKYDRVGHLFQGRFKSEPVDDDAYFFTALRYILRNPVEAGLAASPEEYRYSSAREYLCGERGITDTAFAESLMSWQEMENFFGMENEDCCLEADDSERMTDTRAKEMILKEFGTLTPNPGKAKNREPFRAAVHRLQKKGVSIRQISRLTGLSRHLLE